MIRRAPFDRLVRMIAAKMKTGLRFEADAIEALQDAVEHRVVFILSKAVLAAVNRNSKTTFAKDIHLVLSIIGHETFYYGKADGITHPDIARMAHRAGILRMSSDLYEAVDAFIYDYLSDILKDSIIYTEYSKRRTVSVGDVKMALQRKNQTLY